MQVNTKKLKKVILSNLPFVIFAYAGNKVSYAYRIAEGDGFQEKLLPFLNNIGSSFAEILPSLNPTDLLIGIAVAGIMKAVLYFKSKNKKKFRQGSLLFHRIEPYWKTASSLRFTYWSAG